jgi:predicted nucleic acid-binding Zn ribbon protein
MLKELILSGYTGLLPRLLSIEDMTVEDFVSTNNYINAIEGLKNCIPMSKLGPEEVNVTSENTRSIANNRGRKPVGDNLENDNTATSLDIGNNVSDIKEFSLSEHKCVCCGSEIEEGEYLCDDCLENEYEQRLEKTYNDLQISNANDNFIN